LAVDLDGEPVASDAGGRYADAGHAVSRLKEAVRVSAEGVIGDVADEGLGNRLGGHVVDRARDPQGGFGAGHKADRPDAPLGQLVGDRRTDAAPSACNDCYFVSDVHGSVLIDRRYFPVLGGNATPATTRPAWSAPRATWWPLARTSYAPCR